MKTVRLFLVAFLVASLGGCALWSSEPDPARPAEATGEVVEASKSGEAASQAAAAPTAAKAETAELTEARTLWKGVVCTKPKQAEKLLTTALSKQPGDASALALRGLARSESDQKDEAFDDLTAAVLAEPTARHYALRGLVLLRGGNLKAAQIDAHYALRKNKQEAVAHLVLGLAAQKLGDAKAACPELRLACDGGECSGWEGAKSEGLCK